MVDTAKTVRTACGTRKGPGDADFVKVTDDIITKFYDATGLAAGAHDFKGVGRNSKGDGPASNVSTVNVA